MTAPTLLILNPNSSRPVTEALGEAVRALGSPVRFTVDQLDDAPAEITCPADHHTVAPLVLDRLRSAEDRYAAAVIACHGDPALQEARRQSRYPVLGIGQTSLHAAAAAADRFAVLTLGSALVERKWNQVRSAGLGDRCAAVEPTHTSVAHGLAHEPDLAPYRAAAERALAAGAGALVLGCAGMLALAAPLAAEFGVPVVEPVTVTCALAAALTRPTR
ncbi:hydantoin racemase [Streptomyces sp. SID10853]|uniref:aspartate/glutamate racemase family protein n=1 Tax=Streptomyces sp. SID10853 TaxID=2706028 RepID=UPI0013C2868E|nr:aspartate/glutamate racemase family protein [Streptomyces sp. SID10853]NDZ78683.1 hydantoin racemase [Streptomyces sp. SID10853]